MLIDIVEDNYIFNDQTTLPISTKIADPNKELLLKQYKYKGDKKICHVCHNHTIPSKEEVWKTICKKCWDKGSCEAPTISLLHHKVCSSCKIPCIALQSTLMTCKNCYKQSLKKC